MGDDTPHVLVVDDDDRLRALLRKYLSENGFRVSTASGAGDARVRLGGIAFDVIVLDLMMPGESGLKFARHLRLESTVPLLMLTAMSEIEDRITGFEHGADDYLTKPFEPRELLLRLHAILRRVPTPPASPARVVMGDVAFDLGRQELNRDGEPIHLTSVETTLLKALAERAGTILSREELIAATGAEAGGRTVDVQVTRLRRKIEADPRLPRYLQTVRGRGYMLRPD